MTSGLRNVQLLEPELEQRFRNAEGREVVLLDYPKARIEMLAASDLHNPRDRWRTQACAKEPWTVDFIEAIPPGSVFVDVGANVGSYTLLAIARGLSVIAIEPFTPNYYMLWENLRLNNWLDKCEKVLGALGEASGRTLFHIGDPRFGSASHVIGTPRNPTEGFHTDRISVFTLDEIWRIYTPGPQFYAKIDVDEGFEEVMKGARGCLESPAWQGIMLELNSQHDQSTLDYMKELGWQMVAKHDHRGDMPIGGGVYYGEFRRI